MLDAGSLDRRVAFYRRKVLDTPFAGNARGGYEEMPFLTVWANWRQTPARERVSAGLAEDPVGGTLRIRDSRDARAITAADRVLMRDVSYAIVSVGDPEPRLGYIDIILSREVAG